MHSPFRRVNSRVLFLSFCFAVPGVLYGTTAVAQMPSMPSAPTVPSASSVPGASQASGAASQAKAAADQAKAAEAQAKAAEEQAKAAKAKLDPPKTGTVGAALNGDMDQVNLAVNSSIAAGNSAGIEACRDMAIAISSTQNVYEDDLGKSVTGKIPPALKATLDQLTSAIGLLNQMTKASLQVAATDAEQISNSLPYRPQEPKLAKVTPRFLVPSKDTYVTKVHLNGKFELAAKPEFFPTLIVHEHVYKPIATSVSDIEYGVPITDLYPPDSVSKQFQTAAATLKVPWEVTSLMGKRHKKEEDTFRLLLPALPSGPGVVKFIAKGTRLVAGATQRHAGAPHYQCSGRGCGGDDINHVWSEPPDPNCTIVQGTSSFDVNSQSGAWKKEFLGDGGEGVTYSVTTERKGAGENKVSFSISFQESCSKEVPNNIGDDVPLGWGQSKTFKASAGSWKVSLDSFDGQHMDITQPGPAGPFLTVTQTADEVKLSAPDPATLVWP